MKAKTLYSGFILILLVLILTSCGQTREFMSSSVVPAAHGKVKVKQDDNQNYRIKVNITNLADIKQLDRSKETYVVWMETRQGNTENIGQLKSSTSLFSDERNASLETVTSFQPFRIFVTAEHGKNVRYPGNQVILTTETFDRFDRWD